MQPFVKNTKPALLFCRGISVKFIAMFLFVFGTSVATWGQDAEADFDKGAECYGKNDYVQAIYWWEKAAEKGNPEAMYNLGILYDNGRSVEKNYEKANYWWEKAAERGHPKAMYNLGNLYANGDGVEKNHEKANYWWEKAAEKGDPEAMFNLGAFYYNVNGLENNYEKAKSYYKQALERMESGEYEEDNEFVSRIETNIGDCYRIGDENYELAVQWYTRSAAKGNGEAMYELGVCHNSGKYIKKDGDAALHWFEKALENSGDLSSLQNAIARSLVEQLKREGH